MSIPLPNTDARPHPGSIAIGVPANRHADSAEAGAQAGPAANDGARPGTWKFALKLGAAELRRGDAVATLLDVLVILPGARYHARQLCLILTELFSNALDHGLLGLDAASKPPAGGLDAYLKTKALALDALERGTIEVVLELDLARREPLLEITMRDSGPGFDYRARAAGVAPRGRGIALISALCAGIEYRGCGNEVRVHYALSAPQVERLRRMA